MKKEKRQWKIIKTARTKTMQWSKKIQIDVHAIYFMPMPDLSLEVYIYIISDKSLAKYKKDQTTKTLEAIFLSELIKLNYYSYFDNNIKFIFDSWENVENNSKDNPLLG